MKVKVHWIIDGVAEIEADTPEDAEKRWKMNCQNLWETINIFLMN